MNVAGMVPELSPVPLGRCRGPWRERRHRTVPTEREKRETFCRFRARLYLVEMEAAIGGAGGATHRGPRDPHRQRHLTDTAWTGDSVLRRVLDGSRLWV